VYSSHWTTCRASGVETVTIGGPFCARTGGHQPISASVVRATAVRFVDVHMTCLAFADQAPRRRAGRRRRRRGRSRCPACRSRQRRAERAPGPGIPRRREGDALAPSDPTFTPARNGRQVAQPCLVLVGGAPDRA